MNPFLTEKRKRNSYPNKTFKAFKVYEIIKVRESMIHTFLETVHV